MEIHRLKTMDVDYDTAVFNEIYQDVQPLKYTLASQIDHRRLGISKDVLLSWFDDKLLFVFQKHYKDKEPEVLKGFIINSLKVFKYRILRKVYTDQGEYLSNLVTLDGEKKYINVIPDESEDSDHDVFVSIVSNFMKEKLSREAYLLFQIQLNPPPYILSRVKSGSSKIPLEILMEFLGLSKEHLPQLKRIKKEINQTIKMAREELPKLAICN